MDRRGFFGATVAAGVAGTAMGVGASSLVGKQAGLGRGSFPDGYSGLGAGHFLVTHFAYYRNPVDQPFESAFSLIDAQTGSSRYVYSKVPRLHTAFRPTANNADKRTFMLGYHVNNVIDVFDSQFELIDTLSIKNAVFRGHAIDYQGGMLLSAVDQFGHAGELPYAGFLLHLSTNGEELGRYPIEGSLPHEIIDCGPYLAVSVYGGGVRFGRREPAFSDFESEGGAKLAYEVDKPGVCFLDKKTLAVVRFVSLPATGLATHLALDHKGHVLVMTVNTRVATRSSDLNYYVRRDNVSLLSSEVYRGQYEEPFPMYEIDPENGTVKTINYPPALMRRGSNFAHDPASGYTIAAYGCSNTIFVCDALGNHKMIDSLKLGIADPRGACAIRGTGLFAVSGQENNIIIFDPKAENPVLHNYSVSLGTQGHLHWFHA